MSFSQAPLYANDKPQAHQTPQYSAGYGNGYGYGNDMNTYKNQAPHGAQEQYGAPAPAYNPGGVSQDRHGGPRPGKQSNVLKVRLVYMTLHALIAIATCLTASIITQYVPLIIITTGGAAGALIYALPAAWQSVAGGKRRFVDRIDWEFWYFFSQVFVWAATGALTLVLTDAGRRGTGCAGGLRARKSPLPYDGVTLCNGLRAVIGLSFANVGLIIGWAIWFALAVRVAQPDDEGRKWKASASRLLRPWHH